MNFNCCWNDKTYKELLNYLESIKNDKFKEFCKKIVVVDDVLGVKTPVLKKIALEISRGDYKSFIKINNSSIHEMIMIEGLIYGFLKVDLNELTELINEYLLKVSSWAHIDSFVANLKQLKKSPKEGFVYAKKLIHSKAPLTKRCGIIILLNYYLHDSYIDKTLELISKIKCSDYYVKMACAWILSTSYIKYKEKTLVYLVNLKDDFVYNKTLSKIIDSRKISPEEKKFIKSLKREKENKKIG